MLYSLAQLGFRIDLLKYGMNVIMDVINLAIALHEDERTGDPSGDYIDLSEEPVEDTEG